MSSILGHSHDEVVEVVKDSVASLDHLLTSFVSEPVADLAALLASLLPGPLDKSFFLYVPSIVHDVLELARDSDYRILCTKEYGLGG